MLVFVTVSAKFHFLVQFAKRKVMLIKYLHLNAQPKISHATNLFLIFCFDFVLFVFVVILWLLLSPCYIC